MGIPIWAAKYKDDCAAQLLDKKFQRLQDPLLRSPIPSLKDCAYLPAHIIGLNYWITYWVTNSYYRVVIMAKS